MTFCHRPTQCYCRHQDDGPCSPSHARYTPCQLPRSRAPSASLVRRRRRGGRGRQSSRRRGRCRRLRLSRRSRQHATRCRLSGTNGAGRRRCRRNTSTTVGTCRARRGDLLGGRALAPCRTCHMHSLRVNSMANGLRSYSDRVLRAALTDLTD